MRGLMLEMHSIRSRPLPMVSASGIFFGSDAQMNKAKSDSLSRAMDSRRNRSHGRDSIRQFVQRIFYSKQVVLA